jgi:periplasmic protein TonB
METKKTPRANLEVKRSFFLEIGFIVAILIMLVAFGWKTYDMDKIVIPDRISQTEDEDIVDITKQDKPVVPPPVPPVLTTILNIVENNTIVPDAPLIDIDDNPLNPVQPWNPPVQAPDVIDDTDEPFIVVEDEPEFPGGEMARRKFLSENIKYPKTASEVGIDGTVHVTFIIEKNGSVTDVRILRGIGGGCDEEAIRVVKAMPNWIPGKQRGKPVRVQFNMPIKFTLAS